MCRAHSLRTKFASLGLEQVHVSILRWKKFPNRNFSEDWQHLRRRGATGLGLPGASKGTSHNDLLLTPESPENASTFNRSSSDLISQQYNHPTNRIVRSPHPIWTRLRSTTVVLPSASYALSLPSIYIVSFVCWRWQGSLSIDRCVYFYDQISRFHVYGSNLWIELKAWKTERYIPNMDQVHLRGTDWRHATKRLQVAAYSPISKQSYHG